MRNCKNYQFSACIREGWRKIRLSMVGNKVLVHLPTRFPLLISEPSLCFEWFCAALLSISGPKHTNHLQGYVRGRKSGWDEASTGGVSWEAASLCLSLVKSSGCACEDLSTDLGECGFKWWYLSLVWLNHLSVHSLHWVCGAHTMAKTHSGHSKSREICVSSLSGKSRGISWMYQQLTAPSEFPD